MCKPDLRWLSEEPFVLQITLQQFAVTSQDCFLTSFPPGAQQIHSVLADSDYLAMFHKESHGSFSMEVEPWDPPGSGSAFVWKRRCLFTAPLQGPPWFKTMLGERSSSKLLWRKNMVQMPSTFGVFQKLQFRPLKGLSGHHSFNSG
jgi:hypothetical protein